MILKVIILGIVQGLTEFLPVSSSGHLALIEKYFRITEPVTLTVFLHFGTFLATIVFFFKPIMDLIKKLLKKEKEALYYIGYIILGTLPIALFAAFLRSQIEYSFSNIKMIALFLGFTGLILVLTNIVKKDRKNITLVSALIIGLSQMLALFPGISRSGMTISAGLFSRVKPEKAFRFSFLLSLPAILGANLIELKSLTRVSTDLVSILVGMALSFVFGLIALVILKKTVEQKFHYFGIYCLFISIILLILR